MYTEIRDSINRGSYMSAHVSLNLLIKLRKRDKMRGLSSILSLFYEFNKCNNTGTRMVDFIYHMTIKLLNNPIFGLKTFSILCNVIMHVIT